MIYKLIPAYKDYIWGGTRMKDRQSKMERIAEAWVLSCHEAGESLIEGAGITLKQHLEEQPSARGMVCAKFENFPTMVKLIDAKENLSVQVHPDDLYAQKNEGQLGKTEIWYIVDCDPGSYIYYGFKKDTTKEEFLCSLENNTLCELLNKVYVNKGDVFFIEPGTIHAIGAGCFIAEVQESSNVTYRVFDYGRLDKNGQPRELHISKALDVIDFRRTKPAGKQGKHLANCKYFTVDILDIKQNLTIPADEESYRHFLTLSGDFEISHGNKTVHAATGESVFADAGTGQLTLHGVGKVLVTYMQKQVYRVGVDLGGTNIKAGVVDECNRILAIHSRKTLAQRHWEEIAADIANAVICVLEKAELTLEDCFSVGIGCPGTIDAKDGTVIYSNNFKDWANIKLEDAISKRLNKQVKISNDANCAALGECLAGAAQEFENMVMVTLGTGVGSGIVIDGKIFEGGPGGAEIGHTLLVENGELCTCGRRGCFESYCSATALIREAKKEALNNKGSLLYTMCKCNIDNMNGAIPFEAAKEGDESAIRVISDYLTHLGEGIVNIVNIFRPQVILISGGISGQKEYLTDPLNAFVQKKAFGGRRVKVPEVRIAALGNMAGIVGAANL